MSRLEAYTAQTHTLEPPQRRSLPVYLAPAHDEALASWLHRTAATVGLSAFAFTRTALGICSDKQPEWWRRPDPGQRKILVELGHLSQDQVAAMTLDGWSIVRRDEGSDRFSARIMQHSRGRLKVGRAMPVCGYCLAEDAEPYLRRDWMIGWIAICPRHHTVLTRTCPSCNRRLFWRGLRERQIIEMHRCLQCGSLLIGAQSTPAIEAALDLQNAMLALKRSAAGEMSGTGRNPKAGSYGWPTLSLSAPTSGRSRVTNPTGRDAID